ncbi:MAG: hypothetical protein HY913_01765 [Desulfomonile tiedjei]|nr:hypothetical protein [Desulfomonile tiedjei]
MDPVTAVYLAVMAAGVLWIIWRIVIYFRIQSQRDFLWDNLVYDEQFMNFLEGIKSQEGSKSPIEVNEVPEADTEAGADLSKSEGESEKV